MSARILVVDDASFIRDMVKKNLRTLLPGVTLFDAADGHRAVSILKKQSVDIILSDWEMPGMSGEELLQWVRGTEAHVKTPFIMVTSRGDREFVIKAVQAGVSDYLAKPFTPDELMTKVSKQLKRLGIDVASRSSGTGQGVAFGSIEALTAKPAAPSTPDPTPHVNPLLKAGVVKAPAKPKKGLAQLRLAGQQMDCLIRELSLQALNGIVQRTEQLPCLFESAVLDITDAEGNAVARVNGYISGLQAAEARMDTRLIKITIRFVDDDPAKFESLSKYIAKL